jgi:hypothetical protein
MKDWHLKKPYAQSVHLRGKGRNRREEVKMDVTSNDIMNLTIAFEKVQQNRNIGNGYVIRDAYREGILSALKIATDKYINQLKEQK